MKRIFCTLLPLLCAATAWGQDRIHTRSGEVIDCRILDHEQRDGKVIYRAEGAESDTQQFLLPAAVDYLEIDGQRYVRNSWGSYSPLPVHFERKWPEHKNFYGIAGYYGSVFWGLTASYTRFLSNQHGLSVGFCYNDLGEWDSGRRRSYGFAVLPQYEYRLFLHRLRSFMHVRIGLGAAYYACTYPGMLAGYIPANGPLHRTGVFAFATDWRIGLDIKLRKGLYLDVSGRVYWEPVAEKGITSLRATHFRPNAGSSVGLQVGLRFGKEY